MKNLALTNGLIITMDKKNPRAQAIFVIGDKIIKVGSNTEIKRLIDGETEEINLKGKTLIPGFVDCHAHPLWLGNTLMAVDCRTPPVKSIREIVQIIQKAAEEKAEGEWILAGGYDNFKLVEKRHPTRWDLDEAAPNNPVVIDRIFGGHDFAVNSKALELAGITKDSPDPEGGQIDKDQDTKEPTGVVHGSAVELIRNAIPPLTVEQLKKLIHLAAEQFLSRGVTSVSDAEVENPVIMKAYQAAIWEDDLPLRINLMMSVKVLEELKTLGLTTGFGDNRLRIGAIKLFADGSTSGRTAALSKPYIDDPESTGMMYINQEELNKKVQMAHQAGFQVGVHAIGDRGIIAVLDAIEAALETSTRADHRHRIEHCGINNPITISRIQKLNIIPISQPIFLYGEGESYRAGLGEERVKWAYPLRTYIENQIPAPISSDCPCTSGTEVVSPLLGIYVAVTRKTDMNRELGPEQKINVEAALKAYTLNGAYSTFEEDVKGSIEPGKLADIAVLSANPLVVKPDEIKDINVEMTIVGGKVVYNKS